MNESPKTCWICKDPAATGEHQQKKSDLTRIFGPGTFKGLVRYDYDSRRKIKIQGPGSTALKYIDSLCANCNNKRTQPYDFAYEAFADYVRGNFAGLKQKLIINTNIVFGKTAAKKQQRNLFLYFVKAFGCQLNDAGLSVPQSLRDALLGKHCDNTFRVSICLNQAPQKFVQNFPLEGDQNEHAKPIDFFWAQDQDNGWFTVVHAYNRSISAEFGEEWFGKSRRFRLGVWQASNHALKRERYAKG